MSYYIVSPILFKITLYKGSILWKKTFLYSYCYYFDYVALLLYSSQLHNT